MTNDHRTHLKTVRATILAAASGALLLAPACSGTPVALGPTCGLGTTEIDGQCVPSSDAGIDGASDSGPANQIEATMEDRYYLDAPSDATADRVDGATEADAATADANDGSDPCPASAVAQCDPACPGFTASSCTTVSCSSSAPLIIPIPNAGTPVTIRTPDRPGTDPSCPSGCPGGPYAFGLQFELPFNTSYPLTVVRAATPWVIVASSRGMPSCGNPDGGAVAYAGCAAVIVPPAETLFVMTPDPNAPARNITFDFQNLSCP